MEVVKKDNIHIDKLFNEAMNQRTFDIPESFLEDLNMRLDDDEKKRRPFFWWLSALLGGTWLFLTIFFILQYNSFQVSDFAQLPESAEYIQTEYYQTTSPEKATFYGRFSQITKRDHGFVNQIPISKDRAQKQNHKSAIHSTIQQESAKNLAGIHKPIVHNLKIHRLNIHKLNIQSSYNNPIEKKESTLSVNLIKTVEEMKDSSVEKSDSIVIIEQKKDTVLTSNTAETTASEIAASNNKTEPSTIDKWRKEIQFFGGLGVNFTTDSHTNKAYLEKLNKNQSSILAASFGVNGNLSYKKITFGLGLSYFQTGEKNTLEINKYYLKDSTTSEHIIDTILVLDSLGNWIEEIHDTTIYHNYQYQDSTLERTSFTNLYSWISIPIHFGYRFEFGNYELIPRIGAQLNFGVAKNKGSFPNENFNGMLEYQAVRFNVSYLIQLEARRNFNKWHIFINPYFSSMINPAISNDLIRRKYSSWGIQFGVGFKL